MATIQNFEDLEIWKLARKLYKEVIKLSRKLKDQHDYRLAEQVKSSTGSIMDNIAEGFERSSRLEFLNSLSIAKGESGEMRSQFYRCYDDEYLTAIEFDHLCKESRLLSKKIASFIKYLNETEVKGTKFKGRKK